MYSQQLLMSAIEFRSQGLSLRSISGRLGVGKTTLQKWFDKQQTPNPREVNKPALQQQAIELRKSGQSLRSIANQLGTNHDTVNRWIKGDDTYSGVECDSPKRDNTYSGVTTDSPKRDNSYNQLRQLAILLMGDKPEWTMESLIYSYNERSSTIGTDNPEALAMCQEMIDSGVLVDCCYGVYYRLADRRRG